MLSIFSSIVLLLLSAFLEFLRNPESETDLCFDIQDIRLHVSSFLSPFTSVCVCVCVRACVRVCVCVCVRACVRVFPCSDASVHMSVPVCLCLQGVSVGAFMRACVRACVRACEPVCCVFLPKSEYPKQYVCM